MVSPITSSASGTSTVHGIKEEELAQRPAFPEAWVRFVAFTEVLVNAAVHDNYKDNEDNNSNPPRPPDEPPVVLLAAHNSKQFDYALLLCECSRHGLS